jgi:hypothetical protein
MRNINMFRTERHFVSLPVELAVDYENWETIFNSARVTLRPSFGSLR